MFLLAIGLAGAGCPDLEAFKVALILRFFALVSSAFFESDACFDEVATAMAAGVPVLAVNLEPREQLPSTARRWAASTGPPTKEEVLARKARAYKAREIALPPPKYMQGGRRGHSSAALMQEAIMEGEQRAVLS